MSKPIISVIIPLYNAQDYIVECLKSVQNQTFPSFQAIICDNGSTDNSFEIANETVRGDDRFVFVHENKQGINHALNCALGYADTEWISFLDHDDLYHHNRLQSALHNAQQNNAEMVLCRAQFIDKLGNPLLNTSGFSTFTESLQYKENFFPLIIGKSNIINTFSNIFLHKNLLMNILPFPQEFNLALDYYLLLKATSFNIKISLSENLLVHRRIHSNNASIKFNNNQITQVEKLQSIFKNTFLGFNKAYQVLTANKIYIDSFQQLRRIGSSNIFFDLFNHHSLEQIDIGIACYFSRSHFNLSVNNKFIDDHPLVYFAEGNFCRAIDIVADYFEAIPTQAPFFFPEAFNNYAVELSHQKNNYSQKILLSVLQHHPDYDDAKHNLHELNKMSTYNLKLTKSLTDNTLLNFAYQKAINVLLCERKKISRADGAEDAEGDFFPGGMD